MQTAALAEALAESGFALTRTGFSAMGAPPTITIAPGRYRIDDALPLGGYCRIRCDGRAIIEQTDPTKDIFVGVGSYMVDLEGLSLLGGNRQVVFSNANVNSSMLTMSRMEFAGSASWAIDVWPSGAASQMSAMVTLRDAKIQNCAGIARLPVGVEMRISDTWAQLRSAYMVAGPVFENHDTLILDRFFTATAQSGTPPEARWVDNYRHFIASQCRFGGEGGGLPLVRHFGAPSNVYPYVGGGSVIVRDSQVAIGSSSKRRYLIDLDGGVPQVVVIEGNRNLTFGSDPWMVAEPGFDLATFLAGADPRVKFRITTRDNDSFGAFATAGMPQALVGHPQVALAVA